MWLQVHDRAQVFISCPHGNNEQRPQYVGAIERWSNQAVGLPNFKCVSNISLFILVSDESCFYKRSDLGMGLLLLALNLI